MDLISINTDEQQDMILRHIVSRENEVHNYQMNVDNYTAMIDGYPMGEWPSQILQYKGFTAETLPLGLDDETEDLIRYYNFRDRFLYLIRTEKRELNITLNHLNALKARIPADQLESLVLATKAKMDEERNLAKAAALAKGV